MRKKTTMSSKEKDKTKAKTKSPAVNKPNALSVKKKAKSKPNLKNTQKEKSNTVLLAERFKILSEITSDFVFCVIVNPDNSKKLDWISDGFKEKTGFQFQNLLKKSVWKRHFHKDDLTIISELNRSIYQNKSVTAEFRLINTNGDISWHLGTFKPVYDKKEKRVVKYYGSTRDVTEKKKIELDLLELNNQLETRIEERTAQLDNAVLNLKHEVSIRTAAENQVRESERILSDIAKNLDKKLRESEYKHLWNIFEHSEIAAATLAQNGLCLNYNKAAENLLGFTHEELPNVEEWLKKLFPQETQRTKVRKATYEAMDKNVQSQHFATDITVKSGEVKHLIIQISNILHEGNPIGVQLGQFIDITEQKRSQNLIDQIAEGISNKTGKEFFNSLVENLAKAVDADFAFIDFAANEDTSRLETIAAYNSGKIIENFSYELSGTPCENVYAKDFRIYPSQVAKLFPDDQILKDNFIEGYAGTPLFATDGKPLGLIAVMSKKPFVRLSFIKKLLVIFSARAATEIEREKIYEALADSENRFRIISEQTGDIIYDLDLENNVIHRDGAIKSILGYEKEEYQRLTREEWRALIHPDDLEAFLKKEKDALSRSTNINHIFRFKHKNGYYVTLEEKSVTIKDSSRKTIRYLGRIRDITNEKAREKYIELQANLLNGANDSIFLVDSRANITYVNQRACEILGYEKHELLNQNIQIISPVTSDQDNSNRLNLLNQEGNLVFETIHQRKDGTVFPVEVNSKKITIDDEPFYLSADRDITKRKEAEAEIIESEKKYRQLYESESDAILLIDNETGNILEANSATEIMYGYSKAELIQMRNTDLSGEPAHTKKVTTSTPIEPNTVVNIPLRIHKKKDGTLFSVEITGRFFNYHDRAVHIAAIRDITKRIETEKAYKIWSEKNAKALEMAKLGHWEYTISTGKFLFNDQYYSIHKTTVDSVGGYEMNEQEFVHRFIHPEDYNLVTAAIQKATESSDDNFEHESDARILLDDGNWRWITIWFKAEKDEAGKTIKLHGVTQDIHDWKIAEETRAQQQYLIDQMLENVPDLIYFKDLNSKFISVSKSYLKRLNFTSSSQIIGKSDFDIYDKEHAQEAFNDEQRIIKTGIPILGIEEKEIFDNEEHWAYTTKMPWRNSKGEIMGTFGISRDITAKKKAESDLKSTLEKYKVLFNVFPLGITVSDKNGKIIESNVASERLLGITQKEQTQKTIDAESWKIICKDGSLMPREDFASVRALRENKIVSDVEMGVVKSDNEVTWISVTAAPLPTEDGGVVVAYGDITQRMISQDALKESEERYRKLIDSSPFALFVHKNGNVLFANEACVKMFRAEGPSDIIGKNLYDYMHPDYLNIASSRLRTINDKKVSGSLMELKYYCHDKTLIDVEAAAIPITYNGEQAILVVAHDITEKKNAQSKLFESEIRLRFLIETSPIIVFGLDKNGIFTLSEGNGLEKLGLKPGQVVGLSALEFYKGYPQILKSLENSMKGIATRETIDIGDLTLDVSYTPLINKDGILEGVSGIAYDVTAQKRFEDELIKASRQWQTTFDSVSDAVWLVDLNSVVIRANKTSEKILGKPINEIIGKHCFEIVHGSETHIAECPVQKMKITLQRESMELQRGDKWFLVTADPIFNEAGHLNGVVHSISDITERIKYQDKLKQSESLYRLLSDNSADVIWLLDLRTMKFTYVSPSVIKLRGYTSEEVQQQKFEDVMTIESYEFIKAKLPMAIEAIMKGDRSFIHQTNEIDQIRKDGSVVPTEVATTFLLDNQGTPTQILGVSRDISERKETQKQMLESEERYRKIVELSPESIFVHRNGEFLFANRATLELVGVPNFETLKSKKMVDYLHPDSIDLVLQRMSVLHEGKAEQIPYAEYRIIKSDGTLAYIESTASAIDFFGVRAIQSVARDVTDRKLSERHLKESQERFRHVVEYSPNAIIIHQNGKVAYANPMAITLVGANSIQDIIDKNVLDFVHPDYKTFAIERIKSAAISMKPLPPAEEKILRLDDTVLDVEIVSVPFYLNNSLAYQLIIRDITEIKSKTEELRKLSRAVEQNSAAVIITNNYGIIEYVNPKFLETTGYVIEEVIGQTPRILKSGMQSESFYNEMWKTIISGNEWRGEFQNKKKNGELYWEFTTISPIKNSAGKITHFVAIKEDTTERKKFDDEMQIAKEEAEHAYKVKFSLLANMSHELRTPLNGILGFSQLLKDYIAEEEGKEMLEKIIKSTQRLSSTFTEILSLTELEMGDVTLKNSLVNLAFFCRELRLLFVDKAEAKNLTIEVDLTTEVQSTYCDEGWLLRIATHLLENAIKFTSKGGITIRLAEPIVKEEIEYAVINIIDTGIGIKKEEQKTLFKEFRQISEGVRRDFEGLGLGLSLAKRMSHNLNGFITFESEYEVGSTFSIHIPMLTEIPLEEEMPEPVMINKIAKTDTVEQSMRILLVEDNPLNIEVVERFLAKTGEVTAVRDGNSAVKAAQKNMFDLLLVDISLGHGMDGIEVLKQIRLMETYANIPAIALTGYVSETNRRRFQAAGFNGFLGKPFEKKDLLNYISKMFKENE